MTSIASTQASEYANAVRDALRDLPSDQLHSTVDGLDEHLAEVAADGADLVTTLGPPDVYAAELRAAAGLPTPAQTPTASPTTAPSQSPAVAAVVEAVPEPIAAELPPPAPVAPPAPAEPAALAPSTRDPWVLAARIALAALLATVAVVVIRVSSPLNGLQVLAIAAAVGAAWLITSWIGRRARLPQAWAMKLPLVVAAAAALMAVVLGSQFSHHQEIVYVGDQYYPTTTYALFQQSVPDLSGLSVLDAQLQLQSAGFQVVIDGNVPAVSVADRIVSSTLPAAGTVAPAGSVIVLVLSTNTITTPSVAVTTTFAATTTTVEATTTSSSVAPSTTVAPTTVAPTPALGG